MRCANCLKYLNKYKDCLWESSVYGSTFRGESIWLCEPCGELEEISINNNETNDIPELKENYLLNLRNEYSIFK